MTPPLELARRERDDLADLLAGLTPHQWSSPTLCAGWTVRDVAAHVVSFEGLSARRLATRFARGRLSVDRINGLGVAALADRTPDQLIATLRDNAEPRGLGGAWNQPAGNRSRLVSRSRAGGARHGRSSVDGHGRSR